MIFVFIYTIYISLKKNIKYLFIFLCTLTFTAKVYDERFQSLDIYFNTLFTRKFVKFVKKISSYEAWLSDI